MVVLPENYLERVYAGVLGKLIGVYMGRPFEGWTHQRILQELGHIRYFVNERLGVPIVVTDDDVSGTFTFVRALEEHQHGVTNGRHEIRKEISSEDIGRTWLNNVIKNRTIFWWGGNGVSTEHTAFLNLKKGIPAPRSGAIRTNGQTIAEQIGAQIFVDGFAMTAPSNPDLAARLAGEAGSVSHDGESVCAARLWAAMEAEAFVSSDVDHLLDTGLKYVPSDSLIAELIRDVRNWCAEDGDWLKTRQRIEDKYGYDKFPGFCHVVPNHGVMVMALLYGGNDFGEAMHIVNTSGWDTDCNSGNLGCLVAIMNGLAAFEEGGAGGKVRGGAGRLDWRGPLADRALISSADGGYSINNAARIAYDIVNMGRRLAGEGLLTPPKDGAQYHFSLPGSVQGFQATATAKQQSGGRVLVEQSIDSEKRTGLAIRIFNMTMEEEGAAGVVEAMTDTFAPPEVREMPIYELVGSPLVYPGQTIQALVRADGANSLTTQVNLILKAYKYTDDLETLTSSPVPLAPGDSTTLEWTIPTNLGCRPIQAVGIAISMNTNTTTRHSNLFNGSIWLDHLRWTGTPSLTLEPIDEKFGPRAFYRQSFVDSTDTFGLTSGKFVAAQDQGEGLVSYGTRAWADYRAVFRDFVVTANCGGPAGAAVRVRGLNRYHALLFTGGSGVKSERRVSIVKALDERRIELDSKSFDWEFDVSYTVAVEVEGDLISARVGGVELSARDTQYPGGGVGLVATDGSTLVGSIEIGPLGGG
ncbi:ADP-ribosylglycohydrolase [Jackrogersella minutella]|nr:ADP-ribosylglycohydrolase [Jackrogersella minutella]